MKPYSLTARSLAVLALGVAVGIGAARPAAAEVPESKDPIKIALMDWTSVNLNAHIYGDILKKLGYNVEYVTADYLSSLTTGLTNGDVDIGLEYWDTTAGDAMKASDATGKTIARRQARAEGEGRVVVSHLYEGEMPGACRTGMRCWIRNAPRPSPPPTPPPRAAISAGP